MKRTLCFICLATIIFSSVLALGANTVVVVPLGGKKPTGDATAVDVLKGKTFSNTMEIGATGIRPPAPAEKTGQTKSFLPGDDGDYEKGETWPTPRFSSDSMWIGRTDYMTGLVWGRTKIIPTHPVKLEWDEAISSCEDEIYEPLGLGIRIDDWRLPNIKEMLTLIDYGKINPALPANHPFTGIQTDDVYWTSTSDHAEPLLSAWVISFKDAYIGTRLKVQVGDVPPGSHYALCVRGPFVSEDELKPPTTE